MKKFSLVLFSILLACICALGMLACAKNGGEEDPDLPPSTLPPTAPTLELTDGDLTLILGDTYTVGVNYTAIEGQTLSWSSENESAVSVDDDGNLTALAVGSSKITVTYGQLSDSCTVTVGLGNKMPRLELALSGIQKIAKGESIDLEPTVVFNGKSYTDFTANYLFSDSTIGSMDGSVFTAVKGGTTQITVTASWNGVADNILTEVVTVTVVNEMQIFINGGATVSVSMYTVATHGGQSFNNYADFLAQCKVNGDTVAANVEVIEGKDLVTYADNKLTATGESYGDAKVKVWYEVDDDYIDEYVDVKILRPVISTDTVIEMSAEPIIGDVVSIKDIFDLQSDVTVIAAYIGDEEDGEELTVESGKITGGLEDYAPQKSGSDWTFENIYITVYESTAGYKFPAQVFTAVIRDWNDFQTAFSGPLLIDGSKKVTGYYILGDDIDCEGKSLVESEGSTTTGRYGRYGKTSQIECGDTYATMGWQGVFDGRGYTIDNLTLENDADGGLFGCIGSNGVIKNLGITNVKRANESNVRSGVVLAYRNFGLVDNVYISFDKSDSNYAAASLRTAIIGQWRTICVGVGRFSNMIVDFVKAPNNPEGTYSNSYNAFYGFGFFMNDQSRKDAATTERFENMYMIAANGDYETGDKARVMPITFSMSSGSASGERYNVYAENDNPVTNKDKPNGSGATTASTHYCKGFYRYDSYEQLASPEQGGGNVSKVGNWKVTSNGAVWED